MTSRIIRHVIPVGATLLYPGTVFADSSDRPHPSALYAEAQKCRPPPGEGSTSQDCGNPNCEDTELERFVMKSRESLLPYKDVIIGYANDGFKLANCYYDKLQSNICYLRTRAPEEVRIGTVAAGGVTGLLLGIRGGIIKKLFMTSLGAGGGAYLAYPCETEKYAKKYTAVAYNFITGTGK